LIGGALLHWEKKQQYEGQIDHNQDSHFRHLGNFLPYRCISKGLLAVLLKRFAKRISRQFVEAAVKPQQEPAYLSGWLAAMPTLSALTDEVFGTRSYTEGAQIQLPRKIPLRIEPKTYFGEGFLFVLMLGCRALA
jgi:hypothetical protein